MEEIKEGNIFGLNELMLEIPRQNTVKALEDTEILYLNKEHLLDENIVEKSDLTNLRKLVQPIDVEKIALAILSIKTSTKIKVRIPEIILEERSDSECDLVKSPKHLNAK